MTPATETPRHTLVAMVSTGPRQHLTSLSFPRASHWADRNEYSCVLVKRRLEDPGVAPFFAKLLVPRFFPGFDRYCIVDDDLLISANAPALPETPPGTVGMALDAEQGNTSHPDVERTYNSGFVVADAASVDLLEAAYAHGLEPTVWGGNGDQGALNLLGWQAGRLAEIDARWNVQPVLEHAVETVGWGAWSASPRRRAAHYAALALRVPGPARARIRSAWGLHLIHVRFPGLLDALLP